MSRQQEMPDLTECDECKIRPKKKGQAFKTCGGCALVAYCCTACQTKAWRGHKSDCKLNRAAKNARDEAREAAKERGSSSGASGLEDMGSIMVALNMPQPQAQPQAQPQPQPQRYQEVHVWNASVQGHHEELQKILLQSGLNVDWAPPHGATAAYVAAQEGHAQCLSVLAQHNADLSKANKEGWAPIHMACQGGRYVCIEIFLANAVDANLRATDEFGDTPLILACQSGHVKCMALLLDKGSDPNLANNYGVTAAHRACQPGHLKCLQLLDKRGANINIKDINGDTPLDYARMLKQPECIDFLLASGRATGKPVEDLSLPSEAMKEHYADFAKDAVSRQKDARRCDLPACQASAAVLELGERFKKCPACRVAIYCCKNHAMRHMSKHHSLCEELTRVCDFPKCRKHADIDIKCRRCKVATYCCERHKAKHSSAHESRCEELRSYR